MRRVKTPSTEAEFQPLVDHVRQEALPQRRLHLGVGAQLTFLPVHEPARFKQPMLLLMGGAVWHAAKHQGMLG